MRDARAGAGLTQRAAADRIGIHFVTLYTWESEQQPAQPSDKNLAKAAKIYRTTPEAIRQRASELEGQAASGQLAALPETRGRRVKPGRRPRATQSERATAPESSATSRGEATRGSSESQSTSVVLVQDNEVPLPGVSRRVYGRVFRLLADLADQMDLSPKQLVNVQRALTSPALIGVFTNLSDEPHDESDVLAAVDAAAVAVRTYVAGRRISGSR
jgi:transcriptional regulator with XRE-family HTH domain